MAVSMHIDWLSATYPHGTPIEMVARGFKVKPLGYGLKGYKTGYQAENGAYIFSNGTQEMGVHVILSGEPLTTLRGLGRGDKAIIEDMQALKGRPSRIDLAMNIVDPPEAPTLTVDEFHQAWERKEIRTPARSGWRHKGVNCADDGLYIGKETSDRRARIYDKAAEQNVKDKQAWLRLELQCRDMRARAIAHAMGQEPPENVIRSAIADFIDWDNPTYKAALVGPLAAIDQLGRKAPAFLQWLDRQVIPACVNYQLNHPDSDVLRTIELLFNTRLTQEQNKRDDQIPDERG